MEDQQILHLRLRHQVLVQDAGGHFALRSSHHIGIVKSEGQNDWKMVITEKVVPASGAAIVICDMWDSHWSRGAAERVAILAPRMNQVIGAARSKGVVIIHAPSDTMAYYAGTPARQRMLSIPPVEPPAPLEHPDPPQPVDSSDGGSDTGERPWYKAWNRQHPAIEIDQERDFISDDGHQVYSLLRQKGIEQLVIMGVHTNMCVLRRSFAIKAMARWGIEVVLVRDLTDTMYNPAMPPYVSHEEGTRLVIEFIEKFWCPTITSADLEA